jgi:integrase
VSPRRPPNTPPQMRLHRASGQALVYHQGAAVYLGTWGSDEAKRRYVRWLAETWQTGAPPAETCDIDMLCAAYLEGDIYRSYSAGQRSIVLAAVRAMTELYGDVPVADFGPQALRALQRRWSATVARSTVNHYVRQCRAIVRWGVGHGLVEPAVIAALEAVEGLRRGRTQAAEGEGRRPVAAAHVEAVCEHMPAPTAAIIRLLALTGARPEEICGLRRQDIDDSGTVWLARPGHHKTAHTGRERIIAFGPRAQAILRPFLLRPPHEHLFSPREAYAELRAADGARREGQAESPRKTGRRMGDCYTPRALNKAVRRVCDAHNIPRWTPYQLRHTAASEARKRGNLETAQVLLGHARADVTQIYAERDERKLIEYAAEWG